MYGVSLKFDRKFQIYVGTDRNIMQGRSFLETNLHFVIFIFAVNLLKWLTEAGNRHWFSPLRTYTPSGNR